MQGRLICAVIFAAATAAQASTVRFQADLVDDSKPARSTVILRLVPQKSSQEPRVVSLPVPGEVVLDLAEGMAWQVLTESTELWSAPQWIAPAAGTTEAVSLRLHPAAFLTGTLRASEPERLSSVDLRIEASPGRPSLHLPMTLIPCPVQQERFRCTVPAGRLDLRVRAAAFIPAYLWDIEVKAGEEKNLGSFSLKTGASVAGWVRTEDGKAVADARILLEPEALGIPDAIPQARALKAMALEVQTNGRGFFQVKDASPGMATVVVEKEGLAKLSRARIEVRPGLESLILDPLILTQPLTFHLTLEPPSSSAGVPWTVSLNRMSEVAGVPGPEVYRGQAGPDGTWLQKGLSPGKYRVSVLEGTEPRLLEDVELLAGRSDFFFSLLGVQVRGRVLLGDEPVKVVLWFGGQSAPLRASFASDEEGSFEGLLPKEGTWDVEVVYEEEDLKLRLDPVEIRKRPGTSHAYVELRIPDTRLKGTVVDDRGQSVAGATVRVTPPRKRTSRKSTDAEGGFEFRGLPAGELLVQAEEGDRESDWVQARLEEERESAPLRLVLSGRVAVHGRVFSRQGPVPGARVTGTADLGEAGAASGDQAVTGPAGEFTLKLPGGTRLLHLSILAPGYATRMMTALLGDQTVLEIPVEPVGGTLVFDFGKWTVTDVLRSGGGLVAHGGSFVPLGGALRWAQILREPQPDPHRLILPNMEAGEYLICIGGGAFVSVPKGLEPSPGACSRGYLNPLHELVLPLPPIPEEYLEHLRPAAPAGHAGSDR